MAAVFARWMLDNVTVQFSLDVTGGQPMEASSFDGIAATASPMWPTNSSSSAVKISP